MKPQRKYRLGTTSNNYWGLKPVLRGPNLHPHLPLQFTQFSWLAWRPPSSSMFHHVQQLKSMKRPRGSKDEDSTVTTR